MLEDVSLRDYSTMRLGGKASYVAEIVSQEELVEAVQWAQNRNFPLLMIGGGSNIFWRDEGFEGLLLINKIVGREIINEDNSGATIKVGAGEVWDEVVAWTVEKGWSGLESLSLIPGSTGATPIQNVGAYGHEIAETFIELEAYDRKTEKFVTIAKEDCNFSYRNSRFKSADRGQFLITSITLRLLKEVPKPPFYGALDRYFKEHKTTDYTIQAVRDAVIAIRTSKLPDPSRVANNGSFFANPIVEPALLEQITKDHPKLNDWPTPWHWPTKDGKVKIAAGALIEYLGFKDYYDPATGMATWPTQALVLVNKGAHTTADLLAFRDKIAAEVYKQFKITLIQEPELLP